MEKRERGSNKIRKKLRDFYRKNRQYIMESRDEIAEKNCVILQRVCVCYTALLLAYAVVAGFIFHEPALNVLYGVFLTIQLIYDLLAVKFLFRGSRRYEIVQGFCIAFCMLMVAFIILVSVYPFPDRPGIFFPIILMAIPALFVFSYGKLVVMQFAFTAAFLILAYVVKSSDALNYDIFAAVTAMTISLACAYIIVDLRLRENRIKLQLKELSMMDALTGLLNKSTVEQQCREYLVQSRDCILFMIDIDHFKSVNDERGHKKGDEVLRQAGLTLRRVFRKDDILGRVGGDEFIVLMKNTHDVLLAREKADLLMKAFTTSEAGGVTCSIGAALCRGKETDFSSMYVLADKALYKAKAAGRNTMIILEVSCVL